MKAIPIELDKLSAQRAAIESIHGVTSPSSHVIAGIASPKTTDVVFRRIASFLRSIDLSE